MATCSADSITLVSGSGFSGSQPEWENCLIQMVRVFSGDLDTPPTFSNARLLQLIRVAAYNVATELSCCTAICKPKINPCTGDMEGNPLLNAGFTSLLTLKAACLIDQGYVRTKAIQEGVKVMCGPSTLQVMGGSKAFDLLFNNGPCASYKELKDELCIRCPVSSAANCALVVGAFATGCYNNKYTYFNKGQYPRGNHDYCCN